MKTKNEYSYHFLGLLYKTYKKVRLIWLGVFAAICIYFLISLYVAHIGFSFYILQRSHEMLIPILGLGSAVSSILLYSHFIRSRPENDEHFNDFFSSQTIEELKFDSQLNLKEKEDIFYYNFLTSRLVFCWGINEFVAFLGVLHLIFSGGSATISFFYFLVAIVLNSSMKPPFKEFLE